MMPQNPASKPTANNRVTSTLWKVEMDGKTMTVNIAIPEISGKKKMLLRNPSTSSGKCESERFLLMARTMPNAQKLSHGGKIYRPRRRIGNATTPLASTHDCSA